MAKRLTDLQVKIGADSSGLEAALKKAKNEIDKSFSTRPLDIFGDGVDGVTGKVANMIGGFTKIAGVAAGGFGLTAIIRSAVEAGDKLHDLMERYQMSAAEAGNFSKIMKITGGDVDATAKTIMRLDKSLQGSSDESERAKRVMDIFGVSVTDASGKLLPINQQLENLAVGYRKAQAAGEAQEFIMNTLGTRGMALIPTLQKYTEAKKLASEIKGIGIDPDEMKKMSLELKEMELQFGQLQLVSGSALAPLAKELLPEIIPLLKSSAEFINKNKTEIAEFATTLVKLVGIYEALKVARAGYMKASAISSAFGALDTVEQSALTASQERTISKSIAADGQRFARMRRETIKTAEIMKLSAEETHAFISRKMVQIGLEQEASMAKIRADMTAGFADEEAKAAAMATATKSATGEAVALGAAHAASGAKAIKAGEETVLALTKTETAIRNAGKLVWELAGGWLGVVAAIGFAIIKLKEFHQADKEEAEEAQYVNVNGKDYYYSKRDNTMIRVKENGTRTNVYSQEENDAAKAAWDEKYAEANANSEALHKKYGDGTSPNSTSDMKSLQNQMRDMLNEIGAGSKKSKSEEKAEKTYKVEIPIGQVVADLAASHPEGEQWMSPLVEDARVQCAAFVSALYQEAGIQGINSVNGNDLVNQFGTAYHSAGDGYVPHVGDMIDWKDHVGIYAGNGEYIARNSSGGVHRGSMEEGNAWFGNPLGYGSVSEYTGGKTVMSTVDANGKTISDSLKKLEQAKEEAMRLFQTMNDEITKETQSSYMSGMNEIAENIRKKQAEINKLSNAGLPKEAISLLESELGEYEKVLQNKLVKKWQEAWDAITYETKKTNAEVIGDYKALADAEYEATINSLNRQREERLKEVSRKKDDVEALKAVEDEYTAKVEEAAKKRADAYRDSFSKQASYAIQNHKTGRLNSLMNSADGKAYMEWEGETKKLQAFYDLWLESNKSMNEMTAEAVSGWTSGLSSIFADLGNNIQNVGKLAENVGKMILKTIVQIAAKAAAARLIGNIFGIGGGGGGSTANMSFDWTPAIRSVLPKFADGGLVTAPTLGLIGEGKSREAILPLNGSTFGELANGIANKMGRTGGAPIININNYSSEEVRAESGGIGDIEGQMVNITIGALSKNKDGSLDTLKEMLR
jgi:hypothetical protein